MINDDINAQEWQEYEDYLFSLTVSELEEELKAVEAIGKAKLEGCFVVPDQTTYLM